MATLSEEILNKYYRGEDRPVLKTVDDLRRMLKEIPGDLELDNWSSEPSIFFRATRYGKVPVFSLSTM